MNSPDMLDQGTDSFKKTVFSRLTIIFGAGAALIGMLGIIGMIFGIPLFTSLFPGYKTIAFSAAVIWIIFGSVLACHAATPLRGSVRTCTAAVVAPVKRIIEEHDGRIRVESGGKVTTFQFTFPLVSKCRGQTVCRTGMTDMREYGQEDTLALITNQPEVMERKNCG